jgi:hypothetical protein
MPAPLVSALTYLMAPRIAGGVAELAAQARKNALLDQGVDDIHVLRNDPYLNLLRMVPSQSGLENTLDAARALYGYNTMPVGPEVFSPDARTVGELLAGQGFNDPNVQPGAYVTREGLNGFDVEFLTPMEDFLRYGGRDADAGGNSYQEQSYGQTNQPATDVLFRGGGGANGGLAALLRRKNAKR